MFVINMILIGLNVANLLIIIVNISNFEFAAIFVAFSAHILEIVLDLDI